MKKHEVEKEHILKRLIETEHELALLMDKLHMYPWCCKSAERTRGWSHCGGCDNYVLVY